MKRIYKTDIERKMEIALNELKIPFIYSYSPRGTSYEIDFAIIGCKLGIECDGEIFHDRRKGKDKAKDLFFSKRGWKIIRFKGNDILCNIDVCKNVIEKEIKEKQIHDL